MEAKNVEVSPLGIFDYYEDLVDHYYFAESDKGQFEEELTNKASTNQKNIFFNDIFFPTLEKQLAFAKLFVTNYNL